MDKLNINKLKKVIFSKKYFPIFLFSIIFYFLLILWINNLLDVIFTGIFYDSFYLFIFITTIINSILFGIILNLVIYRYREIQQMDPKKNFFSGFVVFISFIFLGCPACAAGFLPLFLGLIGISGGFFLSETFFVLLQFLTIILFIISIYILQKDLVCGLRKRK